MSTKAKNPSSAEITIKLTQKEKVLLIERAKQLKITPRKLISKYYKLLIQNEEIFEDSALLNRMLAVDRTKKVTEASVLKALRS